MTVCLFGLATDWAEAVADALVKAARGGVALPGPARVRWEPLARRQTNPDPPPLPSLSGDGPETVGRVDLMFTTPLVLRRGKALVLSPRALATSLSRRAEGMARWHDAHLLVDGDGLAAAAAAITLDGRAMTLAQWVRTSSRQPGREIPVSGLVGPLRLAGPAWALETLAPLIALGTRFGAGSHPTLGLGRCAWDAAALRRV